GHPPQSAVIGRGFEIRRIDWVSPRRRSLLAQRWRPKNKRRRHCQDQKRNDRFHLALPTVFGVFAKKRTKPRRNPETAALNGPREMSDLSPQSASKRAWIRSLSPFAIL